MRLALIDFSAFLDGNYHKHAELYHPVKVAVELPPPAAASEFESQLKFYDGIQFALPKPEASFARNIPKARLFELINYS